MTGSPTEPRRRRSVLLALSSAIALAVGCAGKPPSVSPDVLLPMQRTAPWLPTPVDLAAAPAAGAALVDDRESLSEAVGEIRATPEDEKPEDLDSLAQDVVNATLDDPRAYRAASRSLTSGFATDPSLEARLDQVVADDPLALAAKRRRDTWEHYWARTFNAASKPVGQALLSGFTLAPMTIATSTAHYLASFSNDERLSTTHRQALELHREYLARHPEAADAEEVRAKIEDADRKLTHTMQRRRMRAARSAADAGNHHVARVEAERALFWGPHEDAESIRDRSTRYLDDLARLKERSLDAHAELSRADTLDHALAVELLTTSSKGASLSEATLRSLRERRGDAATDDGEALFVFAMAQKEAGYEDESWRTLAVLAARDPASGNMVRHARHLIADPWQNPYGAYRTMRSRKRNEEIKWRLFADYANGTRYPNLPTPVAYTLESPGVLTAFATSPLRLIFGRWKKGPDFHAPSAVLAYRYLGRYPDGAHTREVMQWLYDYEASRGNAMAALRLADFLHEIDPDSRAELAEAASAQVLTAADRMRRADRRNQTLRHASTEYPDTPSGTLAGRRIRWELEERSAQQIRVTRSFLEENPRVAGPNGLGINPALINGENDDGELHPVGVTLLGGRELRFHLLAESGDEDDEPTTVDKAVSKERLANLASMLDETSRRNQLLDPDDSLGPDADRDRFLERARLGLVDRTDARPTAQSTYVYRSMRERYGVVRGRESVLPFDLVFTGNFQDFQLGAYPKWRPPKETPDAFLYR